MFAFFNLYASRRWVMSLSGADDHRRQDGGVGLQRV